MRAILGFVVLLAGIGAVAAHLSEPRRFMTDMTPLTQAADRLPSYSAIGEGRPESGRDSGNFQTTMTAAPPAAATDLAAPVAQARPMADLSSNLDMATRDALARDIQSELARLGCYGGAVDGVWSPEAQRAAGAFVAKANARIPANEPDFALFSLTKTATPEQACGPAITVAEKPVVAPPSMGLGGPVQRRPRAAAYHNDRSVQSLFTNPLGR